MEDGCVSAVGLLQVKGESLMVINVDLGVFTLHVCTCTYSVCTCTVYMYISTSWLALFWSSSNFDGTLTAFSPHSKLDKSVVIAFASHFKIVRRTK